MRVCAERLVLRECVVDHGPQFLRESLQVGFRQSRILPTRRDGDRERFSRENETSRGIRGKGPRPRVIGRHRELPEDGSSSRRVRERGGAGDGAGEGEVGGSGHAISTHERGESSRQGTILSNIVKSSFVSGFLEPFAVLSVVEGIK